MDCSYFCDMNDLVRESGPATSSIFEPDTKRHATYFPPDFDLAEQIRMRDLEQEDEHDETSSYIFRAPRSARRTVKEKELPNVVTPAQDIINKYRAGLPSSEDDPLSATSPSASTSSSASPSTTLRCSIADDSTQCSDEMEDDWDRPASDRGGSLTAPKIRFRKSRFDALNDTRAEATHEMEKSGVTEDHPLVCPRTGCRETLANVHALTYHLHLHDIDGKKTYTCNNCDRDFRSRLERKAHFCAARSKSAPTSPLYATFETIISKITSLN
ncbi:hypothetical protein V5O48_007806 [Marasmius crinis-equi]|uniref:C2H2-type domain-containing protein n=1 Tax=Marasmius crinis-equi TaxID=585013 RepID=A0ABR3FFL5_9AGAR